MRARLLVLAALAMVASLHAACSDREAPAADVCGEAKNRFESCGTSLPVLSDGPCSGTTRIVARCVVEHAHDCDELATLFSRIDACVADLLDGGDALLPPATDLPVPPRDAGKEASSDGGRAPDAAPRPVDGGADSAIDGAAHDSGTEVRP
ncbi:MAG: hypothetical protein JWP87_2897 [Labilithrix sp.]|nr:hypothetical protein [Labilithrix sp.]